MAEIQLFVKQFQVLKDNGQKSDKSIKDMKSTKMLNIKISIIGASSCLNSFLMDSIKLLKEC